MDILFKRLTIKNFRSIKYLSTNLNHNSIRQIVGINVDEDGSNGSGKSNILQAFMWCLYGETFPKIPADNVVNDIYKKDCSVEVLLSKQDTEYKICRYRNHHTFRNKLRVFENDEEISFYKTNQLFVDSLLGLNFKLFHACNIFQINSPSLFHMQDSKRKDFFEEFIKGIKFFRTLCFDNVKEKIKEDIQDKIDKEHKYFAAQSNIKLLQKSYSYEKKIIKTKTEQIKEDEHNLNEEEKVTKTKLRNVIAKLKKEEKTINQSKVKKLQQIVNSKKEDTIKKKEEIFKLDNNLNTLDFKIESLNENLQLINNDLKRYTSGKCPVCFTNLKEYKSKELLKHIKTLEKTREENSKEVKDILEQSKKLFIVKKKKQLDIKSIEDDIKNLENKLQIAQTEELNNMNTLLDLKTLKLELESNISLIQDKYNLISDKKEMIKEKQKEINKLKTKINVLNNNCKILKQSIDKLSDTLEHLDTLKTIFRIKIPNMLVNTCSNMFEYYCNYFMNLMEYPGLKVVIDAKPSKDGEINKILIYIMKSNGVSKLFNELSNGEKQRLVLAEILSMKQIIEGLADVRYNILWLDEVLDASLDVIGTIKTKEMLSKVKKENNYSIELISHTQDIFFENKLTVKKEDGWTTELKN